MVRAERGGVFFVDRDEKTYPNQGARDGPCRLLNGARPFAGKVDPPRPT